MAMKKILFLTGTRADFGKLKPLMEVVENDEKLELFVFITGMHMLKKYGMTCLEVERQGFSTIYKYINQTAGDSMDVVLAKTIAGMSDYVKEIEPDLIVIHGDRVEALAGAIVGSLNNILVAHIEGGEVSGTIDELIRHSVTKMSHLHFVCNKLAARRLRQLGEREDSIYEIGSPDLDIMSSPDLPDLESSFIKYNISFTNYAIFMYHPVTTEVSQLKTRICSVVDAMLESGLNYVVVFPNNDLGSEIIIDELDRLRGSSRFRIFPSINFEHFLVLLKNSNFIIGNSSAGVREAPYYGVPTIDLGTRQSGRAQSPSIFQVSESKDDIVEAIRNLPYRFEPVREFGTGESACHFLKALKKNSLWQCSKQKKFVDTDTDHLVSI